MERNTAERSKKNELPITKITEILSRWSIRWLWTGLNKGRGSKLKEELFQILLHKLQWLRNTSKPLGPLSAHLIKHFFFSTSTEVLNPKHYEYHNIFHNTNLAKTKLKDFLNLFSCFRPSLSTFQEVSLYKQISSSYVNSVLDMLKPRPLFWLDSNAKRRKTSKNQAFFSVSTSSYAKQAGNEEFTK